MTLAATSALAGDGVWTATGPPGVELTDLATSAAQPGRLYAAGPGGVFRSDDGGEAWTAIDGALPEGAASAIAASVSSADVVAVALVGDALWVSTDGGATWATGAGAEVEHVVGLAFDPLDDAHLIAVDGESLVRTTDRGASWSRDPLGSPLTAIGFAARQPAVYVGSAAGLLVSTDGGGTWNPVNEELTWTATRPVIAITAPPDAYSVAGLSALDDGSVAFRTPDGWSGAMPIIDDPEAVAAVAQAERIAFADTDAGDLSAAVLGGPEGLYAAVNAGAPPDMSSKFYGYGNNWFAVSDGLPPPVDGSVYVVTAVAVDPAIERRYYAAVDGTLYVNDGPLGTDLRLGGRGDDGYGIHRSLFTVCCYDDHPDGPRMDLMWSVYNYSAEPATDVSVTIRIESSVEVRDASMDDGGVCSADGLTITCTVPTIPANRGSSGIADLGLLESGTFEIVAEVVSAEREATPENNVATVTRTVTIESSEEESTEEATDDAAAEDAEPTEEVAPDDGTPPEDTQSDEPTPDAPTDPADDPARTTGGDRNAPTSTTGPESSGGGGSFGWLGLLVALLLGRQVRSSPSSGRSRT